MVIRGRPRGNGVQLANYLLTKGENERIQVLEAGGAEDASPEQLRTSLYSMSLTSELTKSDKGLYHAQINPAYGEDEKIDWFKAADMLGKELGLQDQQRVIVLHTKKGRTHAHVAWQRCDVEKSKMISDSFSRLAQDRARKEMERVFEHSATPDRYQNKAVMRETLTKLWKESPTGEQFIREAEKAGYLIASGQERPFQVIDSNGRSSNLVRTLEGYKTKDVREKFKNIKLPDEKIAIATARSKAKKRISEQELDAAQEKAIDRMDKANEQRLVQKEQKTFDVVSAFAANREKALEEKKTVAKSGQQNTVQKAAEFLAEKEDITQQQEILKPATPDSNIKAVQKFPENKKETTGKNPNKLSKEEKDKITARTLAAFERMNQNKEKDKGIEYD